jgi:hypothetical protein
MSEKRENLWNAIRCVGGELTIAVQLYFLVLVDGTCLDEILIDTRKVDISGGYPCMRDAIRNLEKRHHGRNRVGDVMRSINSVK